MNVLGLCAGIGGLELGLHLAEPGSRPVVFIEQDAFCRGVLAARWPGVPIWDDVLTFDPAPWAGLVDVITAGFPCQPWSLAGEGKGVDDRRWIWPQIASIIRIVRPRYVFLENVPALISRGGLAHVLGSLADCRFNAAWGVYAAKDVGAAHIRKRVFVLGMAHALCEQLWRESVGRAGGAIPAQLAQHQAPLEYADGLRGRGHWLSHEGHPQAQGPSEGMADSHDFRRRGFLRDRPAEASRSGDQLADGDGERLSVGQEQHYQQFSTAFGGCREVWAPGPSADWAGIPQEWWPSEQPICGVAHGFPRGLEPERTARIRAMGNAVPPPLGAAGWIDLKRRLAQQFNGF